MTARLMRVRLRFLLVLCGLALLVAGWQVGTLSQSVSPVTTPEQEFGASIGDDYFLATYSQLQSYWQKLDRESDRLTLVDIGATEEGRRQWMAIVSAPENLRNLERYRAISSRLSLAEGLTEEQARSLAAEGKAIVWIDGGIHASEVLGGQQLIELVYQLVSRSDAETQRILRDVIVLAADANPDGHELVTNWYMREKEPRRRTLSGVPRLYQKYVGHDNNRDFYMSTQAETININRVLYREWFPQIVYDHHQTGPAGTVMFAPPFRDPFNYVFDPLVPSEIDLIGAAMHTRFAAEHKPGVTMRTGSNYSTWWNGGLRTTAYFHNQIGLLTETIGSPTPGEIPFVRDKQLPSADLPNPIAPQPWHFRQSIEYEMTANRAVLDAASRYRETLLYNVWRMGKNAIDRGNQDTWTAAPHRTGDPHDPRLRDPRGYIVPSDQPDFLTATKFIDALLKNGIAVQQATEPFVVNGTRYPAGSYVVRTAQAFRPHVLDMFEPQDHPDAIPYPGAPPTPPYDNTGWTLAFQMGVKFDRILDAFEGPFVPVTTVQPPRGQITGVADPRGYLVNHHQNDAFIVVNRLVKAGEDVYWVRDRAVGGAPNRTGVMYIAARPTTRRILERATALGLTFTAVSEPVPADALKLSPVRVGLVDAPSGSVPSGWVRWLLERYEFPFEIVTPSALDDDLAGRFDALILTDEIKVPRRSIPVVKEFVEHGGTVLAIGDATEVAQDLGLGVGDALVSEDSEGRTHRLAPDMFFVPGSILRVRVNNATPLGYGFEPEVDVFFESSPAFRVNAGERDFQRVAWYATDKPLRSGWAWGEQHLKDAAAVVDAKVGKGHVVLFGPEITYRAQPHGTFKFLFNGIYYSKATPVR
jgi:Zinc carboxypeptidase